MPRRPGTHKPMPRLTARHVAPEQQRGTSAQRGYGHKWRKARAAWLTQHPACVYCEADGRVTPATDVDHKIPHRGDDKLFWDRKNWQSLCHSCHSAKTARENGGFGNLPRG